MTEQASIRSFFFGGQPAAASQPAAAARAAAPRPAAGGAARGSTGAQKRPKLAPRAPPPPWVALDYGVAAINVRLTREQIAETTPGFRWLDKTTHSFTVLLEDVLKVDKSSFDALWAVGMALEWTPNPNNPKYMLKRRQGTYGHTYRFAGQVSKKIGGDDKSAWPKPVRDALADARARCTLPGEAMVHFNCYEVDAYVSPHADEASLKGSPIFSYTLVRNSPPRGFQIYDKVAYNAKGSTCPVHREIVLKDGALLIMGGTMQSHYTHGVKKITRARDKETWSKSRRINMTVRFL